MFHKDGGANFSVKNCMSHFSVFVPAKATVKMANGNKEHVQRSGIVSCRVPKCSIIYPVLSVYYFPGRSSITISSGSLKFYVVFQNFTSESLEHCGFVDPHGHSWRSPYQTQINIDYIQIEIVKVTPF